jgi:hypothetical protein
VKIDQEPKVRQKTIKAARQGEQIDSTNDITTQLHSIHATLKTFSNMMEENMNELESKFGLSQDHSFTAPTTGKETAASILQSKEDRREDMRLNKMAK